MCVGGKMAEIIGRRLEQERQRSSAVCLIGTEMRADRGTGGLCYHVGSRNADIREYVCVCVCV